MNLMIIFVALLTMLMLIMMMLIMFVSKKEMFELQKSSSFECGFNPMFNKRMPFSICFFLISVIFLVFDIEIIILLPMVISSKLCILKYWMLTFMLFILILIMGLYHEWFNGMLNWTK
uniref:NADH dehydrogenase subunit 3 n=1 Tax=Stroggylocephalus agrestis TaxID=3112133 RepID=UPI002E790F09|nr:NADH dehydrogenase subunit 3 [Stroggylocephalus agrestis]WRK21277.1 NADH dehydrogenase subunit 3 [Stroggylocephalus agrestis]